jgi:hypothetical protein
MGVLLHKLRAQGISVSLAALNPDVQRMLDRGGILAAIGGENLFWSSDQAIVGVEKRPCRYCADERMAVVEAEDVTV